MNNPVGIPLKAGTNRAFFLRPEPSGRSIRKTCKRREHLTLSLLILLAKRHGVPPSKNRLVLLYDIFGENPLFFKFVYNLFTIIVVPERPSMPLPR